MNQERRHELKCGNGGHPQMADGTCVLLEFNCESQHTRVYFANQ